MAFRTSQVQVGTTAVQLISAAAGDVEAWIEVTTGITSDAIYLGGSSGVTTGTGFRLENTDNILRLEVRPGDALWAIANSSGPYTATVMIRSA